jgi:hypothetical protein
MSLIFLVIHVIIQYHIMILLSPVSSIIDAPHQIFYQHDIHNTIYNISIGAPPAGGEAGERRSPKIARHHAEEHALFRVVKR